MGDFFSSTASSMPKLLCDRVKRYALDYARYAMLPVRYVLDCYSTNKLCLQITVSSSLGYAHILGVPYTHCKPLCPFKYT